MDDQAEQCFQDEPMLAQRVHRARAQFSKHYGEAVDVIVRSPGRAEIIGNHTDYNNGYSIACTVSKSLLALCGKRSDGVVQISSSLFPNNRPISFKVDEDIDEDKIHTWTNYARGVVQQLVKSGHTISRAINLHLQLY